MIAAINCGFRKRRRRVHQGAALMSCALLLLVVSLMMLSSERTARQLQASAYAEADTQMARHAAEAALADGELHLALGHAPFPALCSGAGHVLGSVTGSVTSAGLLSSGPTGPRPPSYSLNVLSDDGRDGVCRITASGTGLHETTRAMVQADIAVRHCGTTLLMSASPPDGEISPSNSSPGSSELSPERSSESSPEAPPSCVPQLRRLIWRALDAE